MHADAGSLLVEAGLISEAQLQQALTSAVQYGGTLVQNLIRLGHITERELASFLSTRLKLPMAERTQFENLPAFITRLVPSDIVVAHRLIPIMLHEGILHVAMVDVTDRAALEEIGFATGYRTVPVVARYDDIVRSMARYYGIPPEDKALPPGSDQMASPDPQPWKLPEPPASEPPAPEPSAPEPPAPEPPAPEATPSLTREARPQPPSEPEAEASPILARDPGLPATDTSAEPATWGPAPGEQDAGESVGLEQARQHLEVVEEGTDDLGELFFGYEDEDPGDIVHLTRKKAKRGRRPSGTITEAVRSRTESRDQKTRSRGPLVDETTRQPETPSNAKLAATPSGAEPPRSTKPRTPAVGAGTRKAAQSRTSEVKTDAPGEDKLTRLTHPEGAKIMLSEATDRDAVARILIRFALSFLPRAAVFIARKDILVGWMGAGGGLSSRRVKGIMIPLGSPSVFKMVKETGTDYFGNLPRTTVNDIFISAMGEIRPRQVLLIPVSVRHKPICILYGDSGTESGFSKDLSPVHLITQDVAKALERIILQQKMNRKIIR